ncbi:MAG: ATP-binding protein [Ignavibacteriales bacterium]|nr:ATP-binding protein [Ignavibacteriales bacterium]
MRSIRTRIAVTFIAISVLVIALLGVLLSYEIERYFFDRLLSGLRTETNVIHSLLQDWTVRGESRDNVEKDLTVMSLAARMRITLIDSSGVVVYDSSVPDSLLGGLENHSQRPEVVEARQKGTGSNVRTSKSINQDLVYVAQKVAVPSAAVFRNLQFVRVSVELTEVNRVMYEIRFKIVVGSIVILLVVLMASRIVSRRLTSSLTEIAEMVKEIKAGNLDQKLPVRSNDEIGRLAELINEMTDKLKADIEQLKKLERVRSEFLGNVSHELRTPIFSLKGFLETLLEGALDDAAVNRRFVEKAYHHANRLDILLTDLIEISRIESGEMKMSFRYVDAVSILKNLIADFSDAAAKRKQNLLIDAPDHDVLVLGDKDRLRQALGNLVDNAIKYSPEGATTTVRLMESERSVTISIADSGPGIESVHLPRIFERFYRVDKTRSRDVGGTGLGLAIVKHIIEAHSSKISVTSEVGKGTTFAFDLNK